MSDRPRCPVCEPGTNQRPQRKCARPSSRVECNAACSPSGRPLNALGGSIGTSAIVGYAPTDIPMSLNGYRTDCHREEQSDTPPLGLPINYRPTPINHTGRRTRCCSSIRNGHSRPIQACSWRNATIATSTDWVGVVISTAAGPVCTNFTRLLRRKPGPFTAGRKPIPSFGPRSGPL